MVGFSLHHPWPPAQPPYAIVSRHIRFFSLQICKFNVAKMRNANSKAEDRDPRQSLMPPDGGGSLTSARPARAAHIRITP